MGGRDHSFPCATCREWRGGLGDLPCRCERSRVLSVAWQRGQEEALARLDWEVMSARLDRLAQNLAAAGFGAMLFRLGYHDGCEAERGAYGWRPNLDGEEAPT